MGGVQRGYGHCCRGIEAFRQGNPYVVVNITFLYEAFGLPVVRTEKASVCIVLVYALEQVAFVVAGGPLTDEHVHATAYSVAQFFAGCAFMVVADSACAVGIKVCTLDCRGMAVYDFACVLGNHYLVKNVAVCIGGSHIVHEFPKAQYTRIVHSGCNVLCQKHGSGVLERG